MLTTTCCPQARTVAEPIIATVALMAESGLPCYSRGAAVENLRKRFHLEVSSHRVPEDFTLKWAARCVGAKRLCMAHSPACAR